MNDNWLGGQQAGIVIQGGLMCALINKSDAKVVQFWRRPNMLHAWKSINYT
jgi:hypothetical protein